MGTRRQSARIAVLEADERELGGAVEESMPLAETLERIRALCERGEGWNGYDVAAPNPAAIAAAERWTASLYAEVAGTDRPWIRPHVSSDEEGNVSLEWSNYPRELAVIAMPEHTKAIKVWGADINTEMEDSPADLPEQRSALWQWLWDE